jgi:hypothetical protein
MGCGNSKSTTTVTSAPQEPGPASNEANNNQAGNQPGKTVPQNEAAETPRTEGIYLLTRS